MKRGCGPLRGTKLSLHRYNELMVRLNEEIAKSKALEAQLDAIKSDRELEELVQSFLLQMVEDQFFI